MDVRYYNRLKQKESKTCIGCSEILLNKNNTPKTNIEAYLLTISHFIVYELVNPKKYVSYLSHFGGLYDLSEFNNFYEIFWILYDEKIDFDNNIQKLLDDETIENYSKLIIGIIADSIESRYGKKTPYTKKILWQLKQISSEMIEFLCKYDMSLYLIGVDSIYDILNKCSREDFGKLMTSFIENQNYSRINKNYTEVYCDFNLKIDIIQFMKIIKELETKGYILLSTEYLLESSDPILRLFYHVAEFATYNDHDYINQIDDKYITEKIKLTHKLIKLKKCEIELLPELCTYLVENNVNGLANFILDNIEEFINTIDEKYLFRFNNNLITMLYVCQHNNYELHYNKKLLEFIYEFYHQQSRLFDGGNGERHCAIEKTYNKITIDKYIKIIDKIETFIIPTKKCLHSLLNMWRQMYELIPILSDKFYCDYFRTHKTPIHTYQILLDRLMEKYDIKITIDYFENVCWDCMYYVLSSHYKNCYNVDEKWYKLMMNKYNKKSYHAWWLKEEELNKWINEKKTEDLDKMNKIFNKN